MSSQKPMEAIESELMSFLGTNREKLEFVKDPCNLPFLEPLWNTLYLDPYHTDSSGVKEMDIVQAMVDHDLCPEVIIRGCLKSSSYYHLSIIYKNPCLSSEELKEIVGRFLNNLEDINKNDILSGCVQNPNLEKGLKLKIENVALNQMELYSDLSLLVNCIKGSENVKMLSKIGEWLFNNYKEYSLAYDTVQALVENKLTPSGVLKGIVQLMKVKKLLVNEDFLKKLVLHPKLERSELKTLETYTPAYPQIFPFIIQRRTNE